MGSDVPSTESIGGNRQRADTARPFAHPGQRRGISNAMIFAYRPKRPTVPWRESLARSAGKPDLILYPGRCAGSTNGRPVGAAA